MHTFTIEGMKSASTVTHNFHTMSKMQFVKPQPLHGILECCKSWLVVNGYWSPLVSTSIISSIHFK